MTKTSDLTLKSFSGIDPTQAHVYFLDKTEAAGSQDALFLLSDITTGAATLNNDAAIVPPTAANDNTEGYGVGSRWTDTVADETYVALDVSTGAAIWQIITGDEKDNIDTVDPTAANDDSEGYEVASRWFNTVTSKTFVCLDASTWAAVWQAMDVDPYDVQLGFTGQPTASQIDYILASTAFTILATTHDGYAVVAPTAATAFDVQLNGVSIGTLNFALGANVGTFVLGAGQAVAVGDRVAIIAPALPDASIANVRLALRGQQ